MSKIEEKDEYKPNDFWHDPKDLITADNTRTNGAGIINTIDVLQDAVDKNDQVTMGIAGAGLALDALGLAIDPLGTVFAAGIGWLIEHVTPFRVPLDMLMGDPDGITVATDALGKEKDKVDEWSQDLKNKLGDLMESWSGAAADKFQDVTEALAEGLAALGKSLEAAKKTMSICGAVIGAVRGIIRDLIAGVLGGILAGALAALAAMPFTFGTSVGIFLGTVAATVAVAMSKIAVQIANLVKKLTSAAKAIKDVGKSTKGLGDDAAKATDDGVSVPTGGGSGGTGGGGRPNENTGDTPEMSGANGTGGDRDGGNPPADNNDPTYNPWTDHNPNHGTPNNTNDNSPDTNNTSGGQNGEGKDKSWIWDSKEKTHELFMDGAKKYANDHPEKNITPQQIDDFGSKMDQILRVMNGTPTGLEKMGVDAKIVNQLEDTIKTVTDSTHNGTAFITKSTIDFIRFGAFPAMQNAGVFPEESRGENA